MAGSKPQQSARQSDFLMRPGRSSEGLAPKSQPLEGIRRRAVVMKVFTCFSRQSHPHPRFTRTNVASCWLAADYLPQAHVFKEEAVRYLKVHVWNVSGDASGPWDALLEVLEPLAVGIDHVTRDHVDIFLENFEEQVTQAAKKSLYPSGRASDGTYWSSENGVVFGESVLAKLMRDLATLENDETRSALLDSLVESRLIDLEDLFKKTLAKFGRKIIKSEAFLLDTAGRSIVQKLFEMSRKERVKERTIVRYAFGASADEIGVDYLLWLMECAIACGMREDSLETAWFVNKVGPFLGDLMQWEMDWIPPTFMKRLLTSFLEVRKARWDEVRKFENYLWAWKGISVRDFGEFCDAFVAMGDRTYHDDRLDAALCLLNSEELVAQPGAVDTIMQHVRLEQVRSVSALWEAAKCAALKPYFSEEMYERVNAYKNKLLKRKRTQ